MKKKWMTFALLLALSIAGLAEAGRQTARTAHQVTWENQTLLGDPAAVSDLNITVRHNDRNHLFWESKIDPSGAGEVEFRFRSKGPAPKTEPRYSIMIESSLYGDVSWSGQFSMTEDDVKRRPELKLAQDVAERAPDQGSYTETVAYGDYFDSLTPAVRISLPGENQDMYMAQALDPQTYGADPERVKIMAQLSQAFRFPVPEDFCVEVTVVMADGRVKNVGINEHEEDYLYIDCDYIMAGDYIYFTVNGFCGWEGDQDVELDYSLHPAGCKAVYRLPTADRPLTLEDLEIVQRLEQGDQVCAMNTDPDNSHVMVDVRKGDREQICVLNNTTGQPELEADCGPCSVENFGLGGGLLTWKDLALSINGDRLVLLQEQNGTYRVAMTGMIPEEIGSWKGRSSMHYFQAAYDGDRLALGTVLDIRLYGGEWQRDAADLGVLVFDGTKPVYAGELIPSLGRGNYVRPDDSPIELSW